ncbi:hypothetical protein TNCV_1819941 [Trichonephila clavipes]|nr:hypothetical protein TNCV_1819941 [Trichonephila clavipes]
MRKDVIHYLESKLLSGIDISEKAGKGSKTTDALDVRRLPATAENIEKVSAAYQLGSPADLFGITRDPFPSLSEGKHSCKSAVLIRAREREMLTPRREPRRRESEGREALNRRKEADERGKKEALNIPGSGG